MINIKAGNNVPKNGILGCEGGTFTFFATSDRFNEMPGNVWYGGDIVQETGHEWVYCDKFEVEDDLSTVRFNIQVSDNTTGEFRTALFKVFNNHDEDAVLEITQSAEKIEIPKPPVVQKPYKPVDINKIPKKPWYIQLFENIVNFFKKLFK